MKVLRYLLIKGLFGAAIYFGLYRGVTGLENLVIFYSFTVMFLSVLLFLAYCADRDGVIVNRDKINLVIPQSVYIIVDILAISAMAYQGFLFTGAAYFISMILCNAIRTDIKSNISSKTTKKKSNNA